MANFEFYVRSKIYKQKLKLICLLLSITPVLAIHYKGKQFYKKDKKKIDNIKKLFTKSRRELYF